MFCAISGGPPIYPVVSVKSGLIYEKELIVKYIRENDGKDPVTGQELAEEDLIDVKTSPSAPAAPPRPPTLSSVPSLLHALQNEWNALMLETHALRKTTTQLRQELSHALYKEDAAMRVLARIMKERDQARDALASVQTTLGVAPANGTADTEMSDEAVSSKLPESVTQRITQTSESLSATRKKRKPAADWATPTDVKAFAPKEVIPSMHSAKPAGITALDIARDSNLVLTGGNDKHAQIYDRKAGKILATLKGHTKKVTAALFVDSDASLDLPKHVITASADKSIRIWSAPDAGSKSKASYVVQATLTDHTSDVTGLAIHPCGSLFASASLDGTWILYDLEGEAPANVLSITVPGSIPCTSIAWHPDGVLLGVGLEDGQLRVYNVPQSSEAATFSAHADKSAGAVVSLDFSENGYILASAAANVGAAIEIFDLRKLANTRSIELATPTSKVNKVAFDASAQFLAAVGSEANLYQNKTWETLLSSSTNEA
ncbi:hypothetical protein E5Q_05858, partial [Mixia osmundae IAM 14324]